MDLTVRKQILFEPEDARLIEQRAKALGMSFSGYVRAALLQFERRVDLEDELIIEAMAKELSESYQRTARHIDTVLSELDARDYNSKI